MWTKCDIYDCGYNDKEYHYCCAETIHLTNTGQCLYFQKNYNQAKIQDFVTPKQNANSLHIIEVGEGE